MFSALNIHQAYGLTELHFGIFVLLAFLLCYRDWRPVVMAAGVAAVHHLSFSYFQEMGYGVMCFEKPGLGIVLTHASYVEALSETGSAVRQLGDIVARGLASGGICALLRTRSGRRLTETASGLTLGVDGGVP